MRLPTLGFGIALLITASPLLAAEPVGGPSFDLSALDPSTPACQDFYQYTCGGWLKQNPIPADQSSWGRFNELAERNREKLKNILERSAVRPQGATEKIGTYYAACMDEKKIDTLGAAALKGELDRIAAIRNRRDLPAALAHLHSIGVRAFFTFSSTQDAKDATLVIAEVDQGGLGLPDRDYYFAADPKSVATRKAYTAHIEKMFRLAGVTPAESVSSAQTVLKFETELARASLDKVKRRDPNLLYNKRTRTQLVALTPAFDWEAYLKSAQAPPIASLNVAVPGFLQTTDKLVSSDLNAMKTYLRWQLVRSSATLLSTPFVNENFDFYGKTLTGAKELRPRWKRCVQATDNDLGEDLGKVYVAENFGAEGKARMLKLVAALEKAMATDINTLDWMTSTTKQQALVKLKTVTDKIGFPDRWRDYSALKIAPGDALGNSQRSKAFEFKRQLDKIGKPVDKNEWYLTPATVNAYYDPQNNNINFPAGILQPPFYDNKIDDPVNYGAIGAVIGHELTHGFDDQGRQYDERGNLRDWWTPTDAKAFEERASCVADQYGGYTAVDDVKLNGRLTLGENVADNGGVRIAYMALMETLANQTKTLRDNFTPEQRFFIGWGQVWCTNQTDQVKRLQTLTDPHSLGRYRVNGVVSNMEEFRQAFSCKAGEPMVRDQVCRVW